MKNVWTVLIYCALIAEVLADDHDIVKAKFIKHVTTGDLPAVYLIVEWEVEHSTDYIYHIEIIRPPNDCWEILGDTFARSPGIGWTGRYYHFIGVKRDNRVLRATEGSELFRVIASYQPQ